MKTQIIHPLAISRFDRERINDIVLDGKQQYSWFGAQLLHLIARSSTQNRACFTEHYYNHVTLINTWETQNDGVKKYSDTEFKSHLEHLFHKADTFNKIRLVLCFPPLKELTVGIVTMYTN